MSRPYWGFVVSTMGVLVAFLAGSGFGLSSGAGMTMPPLQSSTIAEHLPLAQKAMNYLDSSPDPFHCVHSSVELLKEAGYQELDDIDPYQGQIVPGGKYYFTRNKSTLVAFCVGQRFQVRKGGFAVIGGHTDSPNLKVKPRSKRSDAKTAKCIQVGVECYGGGLWHTWFDRDLGVSGRVMIQSEETGGIQQRLVYIDRAVLRIPNLAIHLQTADERNGFAINKEDHLSPILAMSAQAALSKSDGGAEGGKETSDPAKDGWTEHQEPLLLQLLAAELDVNIKDIVDFELNLFDVQKASLGGVHSEFLHSARLDNLASCFLAIQALVEHTSVDENVQESQDICMAVLYDHEEVGSASATGAASPILKEAVRRISGALMVEEGGATTDAYEAVIHKSFVLSSDQAHALHPNYAGKHEKSHQPQMNAGMVIKRNSNQRYATNGITGLIIRQIAKQAGLAAPQEFIVRQDCGCGSTIGPLISTSTGIRAIDMGCPQLSMHSIRETMGICDLTNGLALFTAFYKHFRHVDDSIEQ